jgi:hypothetical protein
MMPVRAALGAAAILGGVLLPLRATMAPSAPPVSACTLAEQVYSRLADGRPAGILAQQYEVGLGESVYGPVTGVPVPWDAVAAWAKAHPEAGVGFCDPNGGYTLVGLSVHGSWAYVLITPDGQIAKIFLSDEPLSWD